MVLGVCAFLAVVTLAVFGQTLGYKFINVDDAAYVSENPVVQKGLTSYGMAWAFAPHALNWHPLTWFSHMLDCQLHGLNPMGHHLTNILLHLATVISLFLVLRQMTGALWRSAFVAAVFAIHPLRAESVAWVAERKDVLSGLFFMLTIAAYVRYARNSGRWSYYLIVVFLFALGLMSKPMLVTLPFVLLLLDYWPLNRWRVDASARLVMEKVPLLGLAAASCLATLFAQGEAVQPFPLPMRIGNALVSYIVYLEQMIWPAGLAIFYPYPDSGVELWEIIGSFILLLVISFLAVALRRKCPYFLLGWLWYLGMLVPVIGILQVGLQAHADRYTYLPQIGLYIALAWAAADYVLIGWRYRHAVLGGCSALILAALIFCAHRQVAYWRNSELLWTHALACTPDNFTARKGLADALLQKGDLDGAIIQYQRALQLNPGLAITYNNFGNALLRKGDTEAAITQFQKALQIDPGNLDAHYNLGSLFLKEGNLDEAIAQYQKALETDPGNLEVHYELGNALLQKGDFAAAREHYQQALPAELNNAQAHNNLGYALFQSGSVDEAIAQFQQALQIKPDYAEAHIYFGNALARKGDADEAIAQFQQALQIQPANADANNNLGAILLQRGRLAEAIACYRRAVQLKPDAPEIENNLAWVLATAPQASLRNGVQAVELAQRASALTGGNNPIILRTLAAAYAEAGRYDDAQRNAEQAIELAQSAGQHGLVEELTMELKCYKAGLPYHLGDK